MKFLWTNFRSLLAKFRAASLLNIAGLAVALAVAIVVAIQVRWDFTYDRGYENAEKIFTIRRYMHADGLTLGSSTWDWPREITATIPEVENYTLLYRRGEVVIDRPDADGAFVQHTVEYSQVNGGMLEMFSPKIVAGDTTGLFTTPGRALISRKIAERVFDGNAADAVGRELYLHSDATRAPITVAAVYEDLPDNRTLKNGLFGYIGEDVASGSFSYDVYYLIEPALAPAVVEKLNSPEFMGEETIKYFEENPDAKLSLRLPALADLHLYRERAGGSRQIDTTLSLLAVGVLVMIIAWINFINLAMAMAPSRVRSINLHRSLGIGTGNLRLAIALEGVGLTLIALVAALFAVYGFSTTPMADLFDSTLALEANIPLIAGVAAIALAVAFLVGLYAARYSSSFDVAIALKSSFALSRHSAVFRNTLIVIQFTAAMALISIAGTIKLQHDYMKNLSWGFQKENIIYLDAANLDKYKWESFGEELKKNPGVADWTVAATMPMMGHWSWNTTRWEERTINTLTQWNVYHNALRFFGIGITAGADFPDVSDGRRRIIFNEEFMRTYGFSPEDVTGKEYMDSEVVGVAENVHFYSMHEPLKPMAFVMDEWWDFGHYLIKITGDDLPGTLARIEQTWKRFSDTEFGYKFLDAELDGLYRRENNMARLIGLFGLVTVIIAMMGVYGLIFFNARYRTKEIAIRRVNGAEVGEIMTMLNRGMLLQLGIAFVLATAIAIFVIRRMLDGFAYRADIPWWLFPAAGLIVVLVATTTVSLQSWRAATANPVNALKSE
jgi:putative ABC transport system permease protein